MQYLPMRHRKAKPLYVTEYDCFMAGLPDSKKRESTVNYYRENL